MELKSMKNLIKNRMNFKSDFETTFSRYWAEVGVKNLSEMRVWGSFFRHRCEDAKSIILDNPPTFFICFSILKASILELKAYIFQSFFRRRFVEVLFSILGWILVQMGAQMGAKIDEKSIKFQVDCLVKFWWILGRGGVRTTQGAATNPPPLRRLQLPTWTWNLELGTWIWTWNLELELGTWNNQNLSWNFYTPEHAHVSNGTVADM